MKIAAGLILLLAVVLALAYLKIGAAPSPGATVRIEVRNGRFEPAEVHIRRGIATRLIFHRADEIGCVPAVDIPALQVSALALPVGQDVAVTVQPLHEGRFSFSCPMNMVRGALIVQP